MATRTRPVTVSERGFERRPPAPTHEQIAVRAYTLFVERGRTDGHDIDDWLQAEREVAERGGGDYAAA